MELLLDFDEAENSHDYLRYLDMMSGEITVRCEDGKGGIIRRSFASFPKDVVVQEFKRQDGKSFDVTMRFVAPGGYELQDDFGEFVLVDFHEMYPIPGSSVQVQTSADSCTVSLAYDPQYGTRGYCCSSLIQTDGQVTEHKSDDFNGYITVKDATAVTVLSRTNKYEEDYEHSLAETVLEDIRKITGTWNQR